MNLQLYLPLLGVSENGGTPKAPKSDYVSSENLCIGTYGFWGPPSSILRCSVNIAFLEMFEGSGQMVTMERRPKELERE